MSYPTESAFTSYCSALGFTPSATGFINSAISAWERMTGYTPFLAETTTGTARFDPPGSHSRLHSGRGGGRVLELDTGYTEISAIYLGVTEDNEGTAVNMDYVYFLPENYDRKSLPIEAIEFNSPIYGSPRSVKVIGKRGYASSIPQDVYMAILQLAASEYLTHHMVAFTGGAESVREADVAITYGSGSSASSFPGIAQSLKSQAENVMWRYRRIDMGC